MQIVQPFFSRNNVEIETGIFRYLVCVGGGRVEEVIQSKMSHHENKPI